MKYQKNFLAGEMSDPVYILFMCHLICNSETCYCHACLSHETFYRPGSHIFVTWITSALITLHITTLRAPLLTEH